MNETTQFEVDDNPTAVKKQFAILVSDPEGLLKDKSLAGWVIQIPESERTATVVERVKRAAFEYNTTRRGRMYNVITIGEAIEQVPAKILNENGLWVKTRQPVLIMRANGGIKD